MYELNAAAKLSILIVNWNTKDLLLKCLCSIEVHPPARPYEVIVVDNASTDGSADAVRATFPNIVFIAETSNHGYAKGNNIAFDSASGDLVLTLNPDTEVYESTLEDACKALESEESAGALGIQQIGLDGKTQHSVRGFPTLAGVVGDAIGLARRFPNSIWDSYRLHGFNYQVSQEAPQPMGTFLLFKRKALEAAAGGDVKFMDEAFPIFFNEVDLLYRVRNAGFRCWYRADVRILHYGGESTKQIRKTIIWESHRSLLRFWSKHARTFGGRLSLALAWVPVWAAAFIRAKGYDRGFQA